MWHACGLALAFSAFSVDAQVVTDGTLGARVNIPGPNFIVPGSLGRVAGPNLFHSFSTLTVRQGGSVNFLSDGTIQSIIARVTGGQASGIDGQIRVTGGFANLFLLNPAGIFFGPNASLNVPASFYASTADYLRFSDGSRFNTLIFGGPNDQFPTASPQAFGFLERATNIQLTGSQLRVGEGRTLGLIGGNLGMTNQGTRVSLAFAPGGTVALGAAGGAGEVGLDGKYLAGAPSGRLELLGGTLVSVSESTANRGSGRVVIRGGEVLIDHSRVLAQTRNGDGGEIDVQAASLLSMNAGEINGVTTGRGNAARIVLNAADILMQDGSKVDNSCDPGCTTGRGGDININTSRSLIMRTTDDLNPMFIASDSWGLGASGHIAVASPLVFMSGHSLIQAIADAAGNSMGISLKVGKLVLMSGAQIVTSSSGAGKGGLLTISASDGIDIVGDRVDTLGFIFPSGLYSNANAAGDAGAIQVTARNLNVIDGGEISSSTALNSTGNAGSVSIVASGDVRVSGFARTRGSTVASNTISSGRGGVLSISADRLIVENLGVIQTQAARSGAAGNIFVRARQVSVEAGGRISSDTGSTGDGGKIDVVASQSVLIAGSPNVNTGLFSRTNSTGDGGAISVTSAEIRLMNNGAIRATTDGRGEAGSITLNANRNLTLTNGSIIEAQTSLTGDAGRIFLRGDESVEIDGSVITTKSLAGGAAGSVVVRGGELRMRNSAQISSDTSKTGAGGAIDILMTRGVSISGSKSGIFARTDGTGDGGAIAIKSQSIVLSNGAGISVTSAQGTDDLKGSGNGGSIELNVTGSLSLTGNSYIESASTTVGDAGSISIRAGEGVDVANSRISSSTGLAGGPGKGGSIDIMSRDMKLSDGASISVTTAGAGKGGSINISTERALSLSGGSVIEAASTSTGDAGSIVIHAGDEIDIVQSRVTTSARSADGGNINVTTDGKLVVSEGRIETEVGTGLGDGGNVNVSGGLMLLRNSAISANAFGGDGGNIRIASANVLANTVSKVTASSELGIDGTVQFESPAADLSGALFSVTSSFLDATAVQASRCVMPTARARSSLAMRILDPDHQRELGYLFPTGVAGNFEPDVKRVESIVSQRQADRVPTNVARPMVAARLY